MTEPAGRPTAITSRGRARRKQVLDAAMLAFAKDGYRGAAIASIAADVGLSEPGLLHHFPSKTRLLLETLEVHQAAAIERARRAAGNSGSSFCDKLLALAAGHQADPSFIRLFTVIVAESIEPAHPAHEWFVERYRYTRAGFSRNLAVDQGLGVLDDSADPDELARLFIAVLDGLELQFLLSEGDTDIVTPLRTMIDAFRPRT